MFAALPSIAHTVVNPGFFADSPYMEMMPFAAHLGVFPLPVAGESRNAPPSVDDIARVAVAAPRGIARIAPELRRAARCLRALHGSADPTGDRSRDLRPGARATCAADAASRARRRRLESEPRLRGLSYGGQYAEESTRVIDTWSHLADREGCLRATEVDTQHK
jgi:hypothetical protein